MSGAQYIPTYNGADAATALEFERLSQLLNNQVVMPPTYNAAPTKARRGMIVVADGENWDPASVGTNEPYLVWYDGTAWSLPVEVPDAGVSDHGLLSGLNDPDHPISAVSGLSTALNNLQTEIDANAVAIGGKIVVFRQANPPTATATGDIWFDTDDGNHQYVWSGSTWVSVKDAQVVQNAVDAAQAIVDAASAQATADGKITTYYSSSDPTGAPDFAVPGDGDLWFHTGQDNTAFRWVVGSSQWVSVKDQDIIQALSDAATAQATADGKIQTFLQASAPTGDLGVGDMWFDSDDDNAPYRYSGSGWTPVRDLLVLTAASDAAQAILDAADAQSTADGKVTTFYTASTPTADGVGDLWIRTSDERLHRWNGSSWVEVQDAAMAQAIADAATAQATADGKIQTFFATSAPTAEGVGDIWFDTDDSNRPYRWDGGNWQDISWILGITGGKVTDTSFPTGTFSGTWSGFGTNPAGSFSYIDFGNRVLLMVPADLTGNSVASHCTNSGMPDGIKPGGIRRAILPVVDNGVQVVGSVTLSTAGVLSFQKSTVSGGSLTLNGSFTTFGTKGVLAGASFFYAK